MSFFETEYNDFYSDIEPDESDWDEAIVGRLFGITKGTSMKPLSYLACPYSHRSPTVMASRFNIANKVAGELIKMGYIIFSPISHTHPIALACDLPLGFVYWNKFDTAYISVSSVLFVILIDGWRRSIGVQNEMKIAQQLGVTIKYIHLSDKGIEIRDTS